MGIYKLVLRYSLVEYACRGVPRCAFSIFTKNTLVKGFFAVKINNSRAFDTRSWAAKNRENPGAQALSRPCQYDQFGSKKFFSINFFN